MILSVNFENDRMSTVHYVYIIASYSLIWSRVEGPIYHNEMPQSFSIKLHSEAQVSGSLGMSGGISPRHAQNPLSGERRKTL